MAGLGYVRHLSESVFVGLCHKVGSSQTVIMRREVVDFKDMIMSHVIKMREDISMTSGSYREGFRLQGSDIDAMFWLTDHIVIWDLEQAQNYCELSSKTLILCDCSDSPPGFALLELLTPTHMENVMNACMRLNDRLYIFSSKYRQITCSAVEPLNASEHGPCFSGVLGGGEYDLAKCFACDFWPPPASKWIERCQLWPPPYVVDDIVRNGCHFVAIGSKLGKHKDKEWRISFSLAEQKLVYSMNHCQFLTYGLLKLFLKESINHGFSGEDKLLCSYHMKTAVFWVIQQKKIPHWCPQNLLEGFWVCFKLILKWVYEGVCPNFFIPENNMFLGKIHGEAQKDLFLRLHELYEKGLVSVLLHIPSIRSSISSVLQNPRQYVDNYIHMLLSKVSFELNLFHELYSIYPSTPDLHCCMKSFNVAENLILLPLTQNQVLVLQRFTACILQNTAFMLYNLFAPLQENTTSVENKQVYLANKASSYMLKLASKFGAISDLLFIAMFYYKTLRYKEAISVIEIAKVMLAQPYVIYINDLAKGAVWYILRELIGGQSWSTKMRLALDFFLEDRVCYINELVPEQRSGFRSEYPALCIPLYVVLHMLEVLCYRHIDRLRAQTALEDLQNLVHHDQGMYIRPYQRDISWQILGICQQVTGNLQAALYSYQQSLRQELLHNIQTATIIRIIILVYRLYFS